jgi:hypothetical protein
MFSWLSLDGSRHGQGGALDGAAIASGIDGGDGQRYRAGRRQWEFIGIAIRRSAQFEFSAIFSDKRCWGAIEIDFVFACGGPNGIKDGNVRSSWIFGFVQKNLCPRSAHRTTRHHARPVRVDDSAGDFWVCWGGGIDVFAGHERPEYEGGRMGFGIDEGDFITSVGVEGFGRHERDVWRSLCGTIEALKWNVGALVFAKNEVAFEVRRQRDSDVGIEGSLD